MQQVLLSFCSRCGHAWQSRRGKSLRCAGCKSPYWDRAAAGRKTRGIVRPPDPRAAARGGQQVSVDQACDILRTWQANRSWVAMAIEDNLALVNCGGFLRAVGPGRLELWDAPGNTLRLSLTLQHKPNYENGVGETDLPNQPYETLEIRFDQCLTYLGAFRAQPNQPVWLLL